MYKLMIIILQEVRHLFTFIFFSEINSQLVNLRGGGGGNWEEQKRENGIIKKK